MSLRRLSLWVCMLAAPAHAIDTVEARHLLLRTGYSVDATQLAATAPLSWDAAVDRIVTQAAAHRVATTAPPSWVDDPLPRLRDLKDAPAEEKKAFQQQRRREAIELQGWWMQELVDTPAPLAEHMTLFWHNHFTSSLQKDKLPVLLYRQNLTLRRYALGNFRDLLHAIARDPAMIVYLDNRVNRDTQPNENFARELMELFTLGIGHYTETDVKEAARAFTGWALEPGTGNFREIRRWHDDGDKTVLGHRGDLDGDEVLDILLAQPATAQFIVEKLWREFVSPTPDPQQVAQLATGFRRNWEIAPLLSALLKTPQFRSRDNDGTLIKSPVELVAGSLRDLGVHLEGGDCNGCAGAFAGIVAGRLGQQLFNPPNVRGWPGGTDWINSQTLVAREQFLESLTRGFDGMANPATQQTMSDAPKARYAMIARRAAQSLDMEHALGDFTQKYTVAQAQAVLLAIPPVVPPPADAEPGEALRDLLLDPAYQLK